MGKLHEARIGIVRALASSTSIERPVMSFLSVSTSSQESNRVMKKFSEFVPRERMLPRAIAGISSAGSGISRKNIRDSIAWFSEISDPGREIMIDLARVLAVHGIGPEEYSSNLIHNLKSKLNSDSPGRVLLLQLLRKVESEKKFLWDTYMALSNENSVDSPVVTDTMATILAVNGWADRVRKVFERRDFSKPVSPDSSAKFIRALSHHPLGPEYVELVWQIVESCSGGIQVSVVREAVVGFYLANDQFTAIIQLLEQGPILNERLGNRVLSKVKDRDSFFKLFGLLKNVVNESSCGKGIELALGVEKSSKDLLKVIDVMFANKIRLLPAQESRIREFASDPKVCPSFEDRKRIISLVDKLSTISAEVADPFISS